MTNEPGNFFAVDRRLWHRVCALGLNAATAFSLVASGSGGDQRTSFWSAQSVEKYTRLSRAQAKAAIKVLIDSKILRINGNYRRPAYDIATWAELSIGEETAADESWWPDADLNSSGDSGPDWLWLPCALITGATGDAAGPVERARQTQNIMVLRLLIALYGSHDLAGAGGLPREISHRQYTARRVSVRADVAIWEFCPGQRVVMPDHEFFDDFLTAGAAQHESMGQVKAALATLLDFGLAELVPHIFESDSFDAAMILPFGWGAGEKAERALGAAADDLCRKVLGNTARPGTVLAPVPKHITAPAMAGVIRMKHRPNTAATRAWLARMPEWQAYAITLTNSAKKLQVKPKIAAA